MSAATVENGWYRFASDPPDMLRFWNGSRWSKPHLFPADAFPHRPAPANAVVDLGPGADSAPALAPAGASAETDLPARPAIPHRQTTGAAPQRPEVPTRPGTRTPGLAPDSTSGSRQTVDDPSPIPGETDPDRRLDWNRAFRSPDDATMAAWSTDTDRSEPDEPNAAAGGATDPATAAAAATTSNRAEAREPEPETALSRPESTLQENATREQQVRMRVSEREDRAERSATLPAPLGRRLAARFVDSVIEWTIFLAVLLATPSVSVGHRRFFAQLPGQSTAAAIWSILAAFLAFFVWELLWLTSTATTPGKRLFGLAVRDRRGNKMPPGSMTAAVRTGAHLFYGIPGIGFVAWVASSAVNAVAALFDSKRRRSVMDRLAGSQVVIDRRPEVTRRTASLAAFVAALTGCVVALAVWQSFHKPAIDEAAAVLEDLRAENLAEATAAFAPACQIDRADFAEFFSRTRIVDYELDRAQIDWAVPLFSEADQPTLAVVSGSVVLSNDRVIEEPLRILMVHDGGWKVCRFLGE